MSINKKPVGWQWRKFLADWFLFKEDLPEEKQILLSKLSSIFEPRVAADFVTPKTYETRKVLTIEDLQHGKSIQASISST